MADVKPYFDRGTFRDQVARARADGEKRLELRADEISHFIWERGLRFAVESTLSIDSTRAVLQETIHPEIVVERLFGDDTGVPESLRPFFLANLPRLDWRAIETNPYDVAYAMRVYGR